MLGNSQIRFLYNNIINQFNVSDLPIEVKRLIAEDVFLQIERQADKAITEELNTPQDVIVGSESIFTDKLGELSQ